DGQAESDSYIVNTTGSHGADRNYVINVLDTGAPDDGVDTASVYGADSTLNGYSSPGVQYPTDDIFLLRRVTSIPGETAVDPAFVALLHATPDVARPTGTGVVTAAAFPVERVNYDTGLNGRLQVFGRGGNDYFASDDATVVTTLDGGKGNDSFQ